MPFSYTGAAGYNTAPPSNTFGNATLRMLGIDPNSQQGSMLRTNNQAGPEGYGTTNNDPLHGSFGGGPTGPNGGAGPLPPYPMNRGGMGTGPGSIDPAGVGIQGGNIFGPDAPMGGAGGAPGAMGTGTGGLSGLSGFTPEMMQRLFQHMQNMTGNGGAPNRPRVDQFNMGTDPNGISTVNGQPLQAAPYRIPNGMNPQQASTMPYQMPYQNPGQSPSNGFDYNNSQGDMYGSNPNAPTAGLTGLSQSLGNIPGRSSMFKLWNR